MKISQLLQVVCVSVFVAGPALASSPQMGSSGSISLCGGKAESAKKDEKGDAVVKAEKKNDKKDAKDEKAPSKGAA
jgi:hypothetical protein